MSESATSQFKIGDVIREHCSYAWKKDNWNAKSSFESAAFPEKPSTKIRWNIVWQQADPEVTDSGTLFLKLVTAPRGIVWGKYSMTVKLNDQKVLLQIKDIVAKFDNRNTYPKSNLEHSCVARLGSLLEKVYNFAMSPSLAILIIEVDIWAIAMEPKLHPEIPSVYNPNDGKLAEDIGSTFKNPMFSDVLLCIGENEIEAHRLILAARSPVFAAMLKDDNSEKQIVRIPIAEFEVDTIQLLLRFIYNGYVEMLHFDVVSDLLRAATVYAVDGLKELCVNYLAARMDQHNVLDILLLAELNNASNLKQYATDFFLTHPQGYHSGKFKNIEKLRPNLLTELLLKMTEKSFQTAIFENVLSFQ